MAAQKNNPRILEATDTSLNERMQAVSRAVSQAYNQGPGDYSYVEVVFDDYVIICKAGKLWKVEYTVAPDGTVALAGEPAQVRVTYSPVKEGAVFGLLPDDDRQLQEGEAPKATGKRWSVLVIEEGMSKNRNNYRKKVLCEAAPLYEGARIFCDHQEEVRRFGRSTRDVAGFLKNVEGVIIGGPQTAGAQEAVGRFALAATAIVTNRGMRESLLDAWEEGKADLFGLSHDVQAESVAVMSPDGPYYDVQRIESVSSVDFVTNPAAGGRVLRLTASNTVPRTLEGDAAMLQKMIEAIKASGNQGLIARLTALGQTPTEDQVLGLYTEALKGSAAPASTAPAVREATQPPAPAIDTTPKVRQISEAEFMEVRRDGLMLFVESTINGTSLHDAVKDQLRGKLMKQISEAGTIDALPSKTAIQAEVKESVDLFAKLAERNVVLPAVGAPRAQVIKDRRDKIQESLDDFFGMKKQADGTFKMVAQPMTSFRNLYIDVTGDRNVTGLVKEAVNLTESLNNASWPQILGDSITRRMVAEYALGAQAQWRGVIADVVPVSDFRTQRRMRFGGYGNLATVGEGAPYLAMASPADEEATYAPAKRGGTETLTIEMIANDDVGAIRRIPQRLSRAAGQTLYEFVFDFMRTNAVIYDSAALAVAGHGNNLIVTALSSSNVAAARVVMKKQTDMASGKRLGLTARKLWVPTDLQELAFQITGADRAVPDTALAAQAMPAAPNFIRASGITPEVVDYWTDLDNYWITATVQDTPMIEVGFWGGEDPQLFVQDMPNVGSLFANDVITYKLRHVYGGAVLDYRGFVGAIVP